MIHLIPPAAYVKGCLPMKLIRNSVPKDVHWGLVTWHPLLSTCQNFRLLEAQKVSSIIHVIYTNTSGTVWGRAGNPSKIQSLRCQPRANLTSQSNLPSCLRTVAVSNLLCSVSEHLACLKVTPLPAPVTHPLAQAESRQRN